ncbi:MAG: hypothetical protein U1E65_25365 [Myxococcota bacterium]
MIRFGLALAGVLLAACDSRGSCPPALVPLPMTVARAMEISPEVREGIAVSTTLIRGDCRASTATVAKSCAQSCAHERAPLGVWVVPSNVSIPRRCATGPDPADLSRLAAQQGIADANGELVLAVSEGRYAVYLAEPGGCAACGREDEGAACVVDVAPQSVTVRDVVLDRAAH